MLQELLLVSTLSINGSNAYLGFCCKRTKHWVLCEGCGRGPLTCFRVNHKLEKLFTAAITPSGYRDMNKRRSHTV